MRKFLLLLMLIFTVFLVSCEDNPSDAKICNPACELYERCVNEACILIENRCNDNNDCKDNVDGKIECSSNNECIIPNIEDKCKDVTCGTNQLCDPKDGRCVDVVVDKCKNITCGLDQLCNPENGKCVDVCTNADTQNVICGLNNNGTQEQICNAGLWVNNGNCIDTDICTNQDTQSAICGLNNNGTQAQICIGGQWINNATCVDNDICINENTQSLTCGLNNNGTQEQICNAGQWVNNGDCVDDDICTNLDTQNIICGLNDNGNQEQVCNGGQWVNNDICVDTDICTNLDTQNIICGLNDNGNQEQICTDGLWVNNGDCVDDDICTNLDTQNIICGLNNNGSQEQICNAGQWVNDGVCVDDDICTNLDTQNIICGLNNSGSQEQVCTDGLWINNNDCSSTDVCINEDVQNISCGFNANGNQVQVCTNGLWVDNGTCVDTDICINDETQNIICGLNNNGTQEQVCIDGQWINNNDCSSFDVCINGDTKIIRCEINNTKVQNQLCTDGQWGNNDDCYYSYSLLNGDVEDWRNNFIDAWTTLDGLLVTKEENIVHNSISTKLVRLPDVLNSVAAIESAPIAITPNAVYNISAWVYDKHDWNPDTGDRDKVRISYKWLDVDGSIIYTGFGSYTTIKDTPIWEELTQTTIEAPANAVALIVFFRVYGSEGLDMYLDDVTVTKVKCGGIECNLDEICLNDVCTALVPEENDTLCSDGIDNDNNGYTDCEDSACSMSNQVTVCIMCNGILCNNNEECINNLCAVPIPESSDTLCSDGIDNDNNGFTDCEDFDCSINPSINVCNITCGGVECNPTEACVDNTCTIIYENTEEFCSDGVDNDGDFYIDCDDHDCNTTIVCGGMTISELKSGIIGQVYTTTGIVTAVEANGFYFQDINAGIYVYLGETPNVSIADSVIVTGRLDEYNEFFELKDALVTVDSQETLPTAISIVEMTEAYESMYVSLIGQPFTITAMSDFDFTITNKNGFIFLLKKSTLTSDLIVGDIFSKLDGVVSQYNDYRLVLRVTGDLELASFSCATTCEDWEYCSNSDTCSLSSGMCDDSDADCDIGYICNVATHICISETTLQFDNNDFSVWTDDTTPASWRRGNSGFALSKVTVSGSDYALGILGTNASSNTYVVTTPAIIATTTVPTSLTFDLKGSGKMSVNVACDNAGTITKKAYNLDVTNTNISTRTTLTVSGNNSYVEFNTLGIWKTFTIEAAELSEVWLDGIACRLEFKAGKNFEFNASLDNVMINY